MSGIRCQPNVAVVSTIRLMGGFARRKLSDPHGHLHHSCLNVIGSSAWVLEEIVWQSPPNLAMP